MRCVHAAASLFVSLANLESKWLRSRLSSIPVDRPIYILGLPRAGTTISAQMLADHPETATHRYSDFLLPYLPYWWNRLTPKIPVNNMREPVERNHRDRIFVTRDSVEGVEEIFWKHFFPGLQKSTHSNILDVRHANPGFENFFKDHIRKLLLVRGRKRYVTKNNPCVVRMKYLQHLFPDVRILLFIRNPADHIASMIKQDRLWDDIGKTSPREMQVHHMTGHFQFGGKHIPLNVGNDELAREICLCRDRGQLVRARALQWASVYGAVFDQLKNDEGLARAVCIVRYEDLCEAPGETISRILAHTGLCAEVFTPLRNTYVEKLSLPTYYRPDFTPQEVLEIATITREVSSAYGYNQK